MLCWSGSFYPQPLTNIKRKSTVGLSIDLSTINPLGFVCYAIYTSAFLYSPVIRAQYAARHPAAEEPTVRFNDFAFAAHAVVLTVIMYTQFWPFIWGLHVSRFQRISWLMAGLFWGSVSAPLMVMWIVLARSPDGGYDPSSWAWIDVVSEKMLSGDIVPPMLWKKRERPNMQPDLLVLICQTSYHHCEVYAAGVVELPAQVDGRLEYWDHFAGFGWRCSFDGSTGTRLQSSK